MAKYFHFGSRHCQKYVLYPKMLQIKVVEHWILYKKICRLLRLSPSEMVLGAPKIHIFWNILMFKKRKVDSLWGSMQHCQKVILRRNFLSIEFHTKKLMSAHVYLSSEWSHGALYDILCSATFIWNFFSYNAYCWQRWILKWIYFPIFLHYNISNTSVFGAP